MNDLRTISPEELPELTEIPDDLYAVVFSPTGPLQAVPHNRLLSKLVAADLAKATRAALNADLAHPGNSVALVFSDPVATNNGWYRKVGGSGSGSWEQFEELARNSRISAAADAVEAKIAAAAALAASGAARFVSTAAGLAGTALGETFHVVNGGIGTVYRHDAGPVATEISRFVANPAAATAASLLGSEEGSVQAALNARVSAAALAARHGAGGVGFSIDDAAAPVRSILEKLRETVSVFDNLSDEEKLDVLLNIGSIDLAPKIQALIDRLQNGDGGTLLFPNGTYRIDATLAIGDATEASPNNTKAPVALEGVGPVSGVGFASPSRCAVIKSHVAGPAVQFNATLGWVLNGFAFTFGTLSPTAMAFAVFNAKSGYAKNLTILNCPGLVHVSYYSWGGPNGNAEFNQAENVYIFMGAASPANAIALHLNARFDGNADPAHNLFMNLTVQPDKPSHVGAYFGHADTNVLVNFRFKPLVGFLPARAVVFDYTAHAGGFFPNNNQFIGGSNYVSTIESIGTPAHPPQVSNRWSGYDLANNAPVPTAAGFAVDKITLSRDTTFYVNPSNGGVGDFGPGDPIGFGIYKGRPCKTVQQAYDQLVRYFDTNGYTVTIEMADGIYLAGVVASVPITGGGKVIFKGQGGGTAFAGAGTPFVAGPGVEFEVQSMNVSPSTGFGLFADGGTIVRGPGFVFGSTTASHMCADNGGKIIQRGQGFVSGNASAHLEARHGSSISGSGDITFLASVVITHFALADEASSIRAADFTYTLGSNTVTGSRFAARFNAVIDTGGGGVSFFPGTSAGGETDGGRYK